MRSFCEFKWRRTSKRTGIAIVSNYVYTLEAIDLFAGSIANVWFLSNKVAYYALVFGILFIAFDIELWSEHFH